MKMSSRRSREGQRSGRSSVAPPDRRAFLKRFSRRRRSIPLRRAVVHEPGAGVRGMPSRGQCSSAETSASCTPLLREVEVARLRTSAAVSRPASSWKTAATASPVTSVLSARRSGALDFAARPALRDCDRGVEVGHLDHHEAADMLLRLDEGTLGDLHRPFTPGRSWRSAAAAARRRPHDPLLRDVVDPLVVSAYARFLSSADCLSTQSSCSSIIRTY